MPIKPLIPIRKAERPGVGDLTEAQECFFILGYTWPEVLNHRPFPFKSETERARLWAKNKAALIERCHVSGEGWASPNENQLRPTEWFVRDAPEPKRALSGATRLHDSVWTKNPCLETDGEYLGRLGLLTIEDRRRIQEPDFQTAERVTVETRRLTLTG